MDRSTCLFHEAWENCFCIISAANALSPVEQNLYAGYEELKLKGIDEITNKEIYDFRK